MHLDAMCFKDFRVQRLLTGETLGDLASAVEYATDAAIAKLVKERIQLACFCDLKVS